MAQETAKTPAAKAAPPAEPAQDDVEKFLSEQRAVEGKRQELIKDLLRQKEAAIKEFDEKLAKLGHHEGGRTAKRTHHKRDAEKKGAE